MSFPRVLAGRRRGLAARLVVTGVAQAGATIASAGALHAALAAPTGSSRALALLASSGVALAALRVHAAGVAERLGQDYVTRVRLRIFEAAAAQPARSAQLRAGVTMARVIGDLNSLRRWVAEGIARSIVAAVTILGSALALAFANAHAALALAAIVALGAGSAAALTPPLRAFVREARRRRGRLANNLGEKLLAPHTVRQLGQTEAELARVRTHSGWLRDALVRRARVAEAIAVLPDLALPLALAAWLALAREAAASEIAAGLLLLGVVTASLRDLGRALEHRVAFAEGRRRIEVLLDAPQLEEKRRTKALRGDGPLALEFERVSVAGALAEVSFAAKAGERVLVTGAASSGKSTLLSLAARLLDPDTGEVKLDGKPLTAFALDAIYEAVQLVSPELPLLRGSVADNVSYGAEGDDSDWLELVALACGLATDPALPEGLATRVDERGANLSAGLRARIALARAAALRPRLLLVDDAAFTHDAAAREALARVLALHPTTALVAAVEPIAGVEFAQTWVL